MGEKRTDQPAPGQKGSTMHGAPNVPFTELVADTIKTHGLQWATRYYFARLPKFEARFFLTQAYITL